MVWWWSGSTGGWWQEQSHCTVETRRRHEATHAPSEEYFFFSLDGEEKSGENAASFLHFPQTRDSKFWWDGKTLLYSTESPDSFLALFFASLAMVWKAKQLAGVFLGNFSGWKNTYAQKAPSHLGPGLKKWVGPKRMKKKHLLIFWLAIIDFLGSTWCFLFPFCRLQTSSTNLHNLRNEWNPQAWWPGESPRVTATSLFWLHEDQTPSNLIVLGGPQKERNLPFASIFRTFCCSF